MADVSASKTALCNRALRALGHRQVLTDFDSDASTIADDCRGVFWDAWVEELEAYAWNCAQRRVSVAAHATAPAFKYARQYPLPSDCLKVRELYDAGQFDEWEVELFYPGGDPANATRVVVTDLATPLRFIYTADMRDLRRAGPSFRGAFVLRLAMHLAGPVTNSTTQVERAAKMYAQLSPSFKLADALESGGERPPEGDWVTVRSQGGYAIQETRSAD